MSGPCFVHERGDDQGNVCRSCDTETAVLLAILAEQREIRRELREIRREQVERKKNESRAYSALLVKAKALEAEMIAAAHDDGCGCPTCRHSSKERG